MTRLMIATALVAAGTAASAEPVRHVLDPAHSIAVFQWTHGGFSTTTAMYTNFEGEIMYDAEDPANSSVSVSVPTMSVMTVPALYDHLMSGDFFGAEEGDMITFESTSIEVTGENTALITGDLTANGITNEVVLDTILNQAGPGPAGSPVIGLSATTTLMRTDYDLGMFVPFVGDELSVQIDVEASPAEG